MAEIRYCVYQKHYGTLSAENDNKTILTKPQKTMKSKLFLLLAMLSTGFSTALAQTAYFVDKDGVRTFYYDDNKNSREGTVYDFERTYSNKNTITSVVYDESFANYPLDNSSFYYAKLERYSALENVEGLENLNLQNVTDLSRMFSGCEKLESLDLSQLKTDNVTYMFYMFSECSNLTTLNLSGLNTENVKEMNGMFSDCSSLTTIDVTGFNTQNVTNMSGMFNGCSSLTSLDVSKFNTKNVRLMDGMFSGCSSLTSLDVSKFDTRNVISMGTMFWKCTSLTSLDVSSFDTQNVTNMNSVFAECSSLKSLDLSNFDTRNVTYMGGLFAVCSKLTSLNVSNFDTQNVTNMNTMFAECSSLKSLDLSNFDTQNVTDMGTMFYGCSSLTSLDVSNFDTQNVTNMGGMFYGCSNLTSIDLSTFNTEKVSRMDSMFGNCSNLKYLNISNFSRASLTGATGMLSGCDANMQIVAPDGWNVDDISVKENYVIVGDYIYTLYMDNHADMLGIVNSLSGDVVIPAKFEYKEEKYKVKNVNSLTTYYYYDETEGAYKYVKYSTYYDEGVPVPDYTKVTSITLEDGIESVSDNNLCAYWYCKVVNFPKSITYIAPETYYMSRLAGSGYRDETRGQGFSPNAGQVIFNDITYNVDPANTAYASADGVLYDKDMKTLLRCPKGKEGIFVVPDGVETIDRFAFSHCLLLKEIQFPASVKILGDDGGEKYSGTSRLFGHCYSLEKVNIPEGVERIESMSFRYCLSLKELILPNSLKYYNTRALAMNESLETFDWQDCELETLDIDQNVLFDSQINCKISLPKSVKNIVSTGTSYSRTLFAGGIVQEELTLPASIETFDVTQLFSSSSASEFLAPLKKLYVLMDFMPDIAENFFGTDNVRVGRQTLRQFPQTWADQCTLYVPENLVDAYKAHTVWGKFPNIVGVEVKREIAPIEEETTISFNESDFVNTDNTSVDLNNTVVNDTYFCINNTSAANPDGFYDSTEKCIVINKATSNSGIETAVASDLGSSDFISNYTGIVIEVNGQGSVKINAQTIGNNKLAVKIGNADAKTYTQATKGDVTINYDVTENTYVYIYAVDADNQQQSLSMDVTDTSDNAVKVYSVTVTPDATAIETVTEATIPTAVFGKVYSIDGKQFSQPQKGLNILKMSDGTTRKVVK